MTFSGRTDLVDAVVSLDNNAYVRDLTRLDGLQSWLDSVGLSVAEAGRVQPSYGSPLFNEGQPDRGLSTQERVQLSAIVAAAAASTFAAVHPERGVANATVGVGAVVTAIGTGVFMTETSWLSLGTMVTGLTAMVIGVTARERAARAHAPPPAEARFTVTPTMMSRHNRWEPGITARLRF